MSGKMVKCPGCDLELDEDDYAGQMAHMDEFHPDIVKARREEREDDAQEDELV